MGMDSVLVEEPRFRQAVQRKPPGSQASTMRTAASLLAATRMESDAGGCPAKAEKREF